MQKSISLLVTLAALATAAPALAQDAAMLRAERHLNALVNMQLRNNMLPGTILDSLTELHFRSDVDGSGAVNASDEMLLERVERNKRRKSHFSYWAQHDLDGDGTVMMEEIRLTYWHEARVALNRKNDPDFYTPAAIEARVQARVENRLEGLHDLDGDGVFTFEEALAGAESDLPLSPEAIKADYESGRAGHAPRFNVTPDLDANGDGGVTLEEFLTPYRTLLGIYDNDGDGQLSEDEYAPLKAAAQTNFKAVKALGPATWLD